MNFSLLLALLLLSTTDTRARPPVVTVRVLEPVKLMAGASVQARVLVAVAEGYHLQANPASEAYLIATRLELKAAEDISIGKLNYPKGKPYRLNGADKEIQTYEGSFEIGVPLKAEERARSGERILQGRLHYQACDSKTCLFPTSVPVTLTLQIVEARPKSKVNHKGTKYTKQAGLELCSISGPTSAN